MKKIILILISILCISNISFAQKIKLSQNRNGVHCIKTSDEKIKFNDDFNVSLMKCFNGSFYQYYIVGSTETNKVHHFPVNAKMLLKLFDNTTIELSSIYSNIEQTDEYSWTPFAYYPISETQLSQVFNGINKIRIELYSYDKKKETAFADYQDAEFKKDKLGKELKKMYAVIATEAQKIQENEKGLQLKNANESF